MKTIIEWLQLLPEPYRSNATDAIKKARGGEIPDTEVSSMYRMLMTSWSWDACPKNQEMSWAALCDAYKKNPDFVPPDAVIDTPKPKLDLFNTESGCNAAKLRALWPSATDITAAIEEDAGHCYHHPSFSAKRAIPIGTKVEGLHSKGSDVYEWRDCGPYKERMSLPYLVRWLPGSGGQRFRSICDWFDSFPEPYRRLAFEAHKSAPNGTHLDTPVSSAAYAVTYGICFYEAQIIPGQVNWKDIYDHLCTDPEHLTKRIEHTKPKETMDKTFKEWYETFPEPFRSEAITASNEQHGQTRLNRRTSNPATAVSDGFTWSKTPRGRGKVGEEGDIGWETICEGLKKDKEFINKLCYGGEATITTAATAAKGTADMTNGTYSVKIILEKATKELAANKTALEKLAAKQAANKTYQEAIVKMLAPTADGKDTPELAALRPVAMPKSITDLAPTGSEAAEFSSTYIRVKHSYPRVTDNTQRLARAVAALSAMAEDKISWNDDIGFVLADFTMNNGSQEVNDAWSFEVPAPRG
jgi:hypothetical protein